MPDLDFRVRKATGEARLVELSGLVDASTIQILEDLLGRLVEKAPRRVVFDFHDVGYINSMGIAALVNFRSDLAEKGGTVAIARPDREVAVTMANLGLTEIVPLYGRISAALQGSDGDVIKPRKLQAVERPMPVNGDRASAILVSPRANHFTDVCCMRLGRAASSIEVATTPEEARRKLSENGYGLLILEDRMPGAEELLSEVKGSIGGGLMSVLKLYARGTDLGRYDDFKIWENDYLIEPFEVRELFVMAERELARVPGERRRTLQESRMRFSSKLGNVARATTLVENLVAQSGFDEHSAIKVLSAVKEGIDNAVRHGNKGDPRRSVEVVFVLRSDRAIIHIEDEGKGFRWQDYLERARGGDAFRLAKQARQAGKRGGLGIKIMFECTDEMRYHGSGSHLELVKKLR